MKRIDTLFLMLGIAAAPLFAQQENNSLPARSLTIEGRYNADVTDARKIMPVPMKPETYVSSNPVEYALEGHPYMEYHRSPLNAPDSPSAGGDGYAGLIRFGYGMCGNIDALVNAGVSVGDAGLLKINGTLTGWNTKINDWNSKLYKGAFNLNYIHSLDENSVVDVNGCIGYEYANFRPNGDSGRDNGRNIMTAGVDAGYRSVFSSGIYFNARAGWYINTDDNITMKPFTAKENLFRLDGMMGYELSDAVSVRLNLRMKSAFYDWRNRYGFSFAYSNYTSVSLRPEFVWKTTDFTALAGMDATLRTTFSPVVRIAPYVRLLYKVSPKVALFADVTGGTEEYDMRRLYEISPYWSEGTQTVDGYVRLDASLGGVWNALPELELSLRGGYRSMADHLFQKMQNVDVYSSRLVQSDATSAFAEFSGSYVGSDRFRTGLTVRYSRWNADNQDMMILQMLPELEAGLSMNARISERLWVNAEYRFALMTEVSNEAGCMRLPAVNDLNVGVNCHVQDNLDISLRCTNLFGSDYYRFAGYRNQGTALTASLLFRF